MKRLLLIFISCVGVQLGLYAQNDTSEVSYKKIFEFVARTSNWGFVNWKDNKNINESAVLYTNMGNAILIGEKGGVPTRLLAVEFSKEGAIFSHIDHVHPNNDSEPSGTGGKNGDIPEIYNMKRNGVVFSTPEEFQFRIFTPKNRKYHYYDIYSTSIVYNHLILSQQRN